MSLDDSILEDGDNNQKSDWIDNLLEQLKADETAAGSVIPRGVYKIIQWDDGVPSIVGDDIDRTVVPESDSTPTEDSADENTQNDDLEYNPQPIPVETTQQSDNPQSTRVAKWSAMLRGHEVEVESRATVPAAASGLAMASMLMHRRKKGQTLESEIEALGGEKAEQPDRSVFSSSARFKRRMEFKRNIKSD